MKRGLTQIEILIAVAILAALFLLGTVIFASYIRQDQLLTETEKIKSLINEAKMRTIAGFSLGGESRNFGVYFQPDYYVLFPGLSYDSSDSNNQKFDLAETMEIKTITFPASSLVFAKISGEVLDYDSEQNYLVVKDKGSTRERKISVNQLGVVIIEAL